ILSHGQPPERGVADTACNGSKLQCYAHRKQHEKYHDSNEACRRIQLLDKDYWQFVDKYITQDPSADSGENSRKSHCKKIQSKQVVSKRRSDHSKDSESDSIKL